jgi:hypothetical protein
MAEIIAAQYQIEEIIIIKLYENPLLDAVIEML